MLIKNISKSRFIRLISITLIITVIYAYFPYKGFASTRDKFEIQEFNNDYVRGILLKNIGLKYSR